MHHKNKYYRIKLNKYLYLFQEYQKFDILNRDNLKRTKLMLSDRMTIPTSISDMKEFSV